MDRPTRRRGHLANFTALFGSRRGEVLATLPNHIGAGIRRSIDTLGLVLDELLHRGWHRVEVRQPLFVVAPPRSGTTMLYHQLAADPRFAAPTLGDTMMRSVTMNGLFRRLGERPAFAKVAAQIDAQMAQLDHTHDLRLGLLEEDEAFFNDHFATNNLHLFFPTLAARLPTMPRLDERPPRVQRAVMRRYRNFVRRFLYHRGPQRTFLSKNVALAGRLACFERSFPDARYIHIVRDPVEQIPSAIELVRAVAQTSHGRVWPQDHPYWRLVAAELIEQHRRLLAWERKLPASRWLTLRYVDMIADPAAALRKVYEHFAIPSSPEFEANLVQAGTRAEAFRKARQYALEPFGLSAAQVREQLAEVYAAYDP